MKFIALILFALRLHAAPAFIGSQISWPSFGSNVVYRVWSVYDTNPAYYPAGWTAFNQGWQEVEHGDRGWLADTTGTSVSVVGAQLFYVTVAQGHVPYGAAKASWQLAVFEPPLAPMAITAVLK